jgi:hypothetical protein
MFRRTFLAEIAAWFAICLPCGQGRQKMCPVASDGLCCAQSLPSQWVVCYPPGEHRMANRFLTMLNEGDEKSVMAWMKYSNDQGKRSGWWYEKIHAPIDFSAYDPSSLSQPSPGIAHRVHAAIRDAKRTPNEIISMTPHELERLL